MIYAKFYADTTRISHSENILAGLVDWIKQAYHQRIFVSKMVYIRVDNILANMFRNRLKRH